MSGSASCRVAHVSSTCQLSGRSTSGSSRMRDDDACDGGTDERRRARRRSMLLAVIFGAAAGDDVIRVSPDEVASVRLADVVNVQRNGVECDVISYELVSNRRRRIVRRVKFSSEEAAEKFRANLKSRTSVESPPHLENSVRGEQRRVLVLVNPFSGQKRALELWKRDGAPVLADAGIAADVVLTEFAGHATQLIGELDIRRFQAVLVNGGDGLMSEVLNGLLGRKDKASALRLPILHLPGGTSNALAAAVCFACNEPYSARNVFIRESALFAVQPKYLPLSLYTVATAHDGVKNMFMSATWGLIADIDLASERFRWAGMIRLHMEAILRIMQLPSTSTYRAKISYIPVNNAQVSRNTLLKGEEFTSGTTHPDFLEESMELLKTMPRLTDPVPATWTTIDGEWVMVNVTTCSHLGSDLPFLPTTKLDEPIMYLTLIDWKTIRSRFEVAWLFSTMNDRKHLDYPCFQVIPAWAVRVEPHANNANAGMFAIDGEACTPGSAFQVLPSVDRAFVVGR